MQNSQIHKTHQTSKSDLNDIYKIIIQLRDKINEFYKVNIEDKKALSP